MKNFAASQSSSHGEAKHSASVFESIGRENRWRNLWLFDDLNLEWLWLMIIGAGALSGLSSDEKFEPIFNRFSRY
jgi:hypothetical protein